MLEVELEALNRADPLLEIMVELVAVETVLKETVVLTLELLIQVVELEQTNTEVQQVDQEL